MASIEKNVALNGNQSLRLGTKNSFYSLVHFCSCNWEQKCTKLKFVSFMKTFFQKIRILWQNIPCFENVF
jgi:hypothetical protein